MEVRKSIAADYSRLQALYPRAFPSEDLLPLVNALLEQTPGILSLVAVEDMGVIGHVIFTLCHVEGDAHTVALLGPLAVLPERQQQGTGSALVQAGFDFLKRASVSRVFVLGDPAYYRRFGFVPDFKVTPPYPIPKEWIGAWQSLGLNPAAAAPIGKLRLPEPWLQPPLWTP